MGQKKTFVRKNYGTLYKWSVRTGPQGKNKTRRERINPIGDVACDVGYVYNQQIVNGQLERLLYVECGYVQ